MAYSAPLYMEVRWRLHGSDEAWSEPRRVNPVREVVVEELDRTKQYDFEARNVSACGAKSDWVPSTHTVPDVPPGNLTLADIKTEADNAAADALAANQELANIASDNILSQGEKPVVIRDTNVITTEQAGIDAQATAFGVTTEKTAYDSAVTALTTYLATLTTPVLWSDLSGDTTIVGTTFRSKFADVYTTRQALLNAIYAAAKAKADAAQTTANKANSLASQVAVINPGFDAGDTGWLKEAGWSIKTDGSFGFGQGYAQHTAVAGSPDAALRNNAICFVQPGKSYKVQALIKAAGADGSCYARISWRDISDTEIGFVAGNQITGSAIAGSFATGAAPTGAVYAHAEIAVGSHTTGTYQVDNVISSLQPATVDEIDDGLIYARTQAFTMQNGVVVPFGNGDNLIPNHSFATNDAAVPANVSRSVGKDVCDGWFVSYVDSAYMSVVYEDASDRVLFRLLQGVTVPASTTIGAIILGRRKIAVTPGETLYVATTMRRDSNQTYPGSPTLSIFGGLHFYDSSGAIISDLGAAGDKTVTAQTVKYATITVPGNASYALPRAAVTHATAGAFDTSAGLYADVRIVDVQVVRQLALEQPGSGRKIGNQFNAPNSLTLNYGAVRSATALTATSAGAVSVNAFTYYTGAASVHYNAVSNAVTGLSQGQTYYIYCRDAGPSGGTPTWLATTNVNALLQTYDDIVVAGSVLIPTSGSSGGGGTGTSGSGCVEESMWVRPGLRASATRWWHWLSCFDLFDGRGKRKHRVRGTPKIQVEPCVRIVTEYGAALICSSRTPFTNRDGSMAMAHEMAGRWVLTDGGWERVTKVMPAGMRRVVRIKVSGLSYAAGENPTHRIYSHNPIK